jgi:hypothetical protein
MVYRDGFSLAECPQYAVIYTPPLRDPLPSDDGFGIPLVPCQLELFHLRLTLGLGDCVIWSGIGLVEGQGAEEGRVMHTHLQRRDIYDRPT